MHECDSVAANDCSPARRTLDQPREGESAFSVNKKERLARQDEEVLMTIMA